MKKIIFVCTGNTCRSPMAEGIANALLKDKYSAESFGLSAPVGSSASENAVIAMAEIGIDISAHRARQLTLADIDSADLVVALGASHFNYLTQIMGDTSKLMLLKNGISDPYMQDITVYRRCRDEIRRAIADMFLEIEISPMAESDVPYIAEMERESFSSPWSENGIRAEMCNENALFLTAGFNGRAIGYIGCYLCANEAYIANIAVKKEYRGLGIGKKLTENLISRIKSLSAEFVSLEVRQSNDIAKRMYEKLGFEKVGERKNFYVKPTENADIYTLYF